MHSPISVAIQLALASLCLAPVYADWPEHRGNTSRSGYYEQKLASTSWHPSWKSTELAPPSPAWPDPARGSLWHNLESISPRVTDDWGDVPIIALDRAGKPHLLVASSGSNQLASFDLNSGEVQWRVTTQAPIRFAPATAGGMAYFGADDGLVRAIDLVSGEQRWKTRLGPEMPWIVGNGSLIAPHPIRTSVLVSGDRVVAHAGLFPGQGVYSVALQIDDGRLLWRRRLSQSPQGYLLEAGDLRVIVPCGRATPFALDSTDGRYLHELPSAGGSFCMVTPDAFLSGPGNANIVQLYTQEDQAKLLPFSGKAVAAGSGKLWAADSTHLRCYDSSKLLAQADDSLLWSVACELSAHLIVSGPSPDNSAVGRQFVFVAGGSDVAVYDASDGGLLSILRITDSQDSVQYIAVSSATQSTPEVLFATTKSGEVFCWQGRAPNPEYANNPEVTAWPVNIGPQGNDHSTAPDLPASDVESLVPLAKETVERSSRLLAKLASDAGLALVLNDLTGELTRGMLANSRLRVVVVVEDENAAATLRDGFRKTDGYGRRVNVWNIEPKDALPFADGIFNLVVEVGTAKRSPSELMSLVAAGGWLQAGDNQQPQRKPWLQGAGRWTHQYANAANTADSGDRLVGSADSFRLQWFGGVGPQRMPDRHLRGPAPLAAADSMIVHGDGVLIGVDPANGVERWQRVLPEKAMRFVMPYDAGYSALTPDGQSLFVAAGKEIWQLDAHRGRLLQSMELPDFTEELQWGYLAEMDGALYAGGMKPTAPRLELDRAAARDSYANQDYNSRRPLVCSRLFCRLDHSHFAHSHLDHNSAVAWHYAAQGVIPHSTISINGAARRAVWVEGRSDACRSHASDRVEVSQLMEDAWLVCLDLDTGKTIWEQPLEWPSAENILYSQLVDDTIILVTSRSLRNVAEYSVRVVSLRDGNPLWENSQRHVRQGLYHGEQVHHPVALRQRDGRVWLVLEPFLYDLESGERVVPEGLPADWALNRPGHSCGTLSGAGHCLFFRAGNPTVLNLSATNNSQAFTKLSPSRPSCWINMIPATGKLLIPEGSASCVCSYSLQTSMAFVPLRDKAGDTRLPILDDYLSRAATMLRE